MRKIDKKFKGIIVKSISTHYMISYDNKIIDLETDEIMYPSELSEFIETSFDIKKDIADLIVFGWLLENDFEDIRLNWEAPYSFNGYNTTGIVLGGPENQLMFDYDDTITLTGDYITGGTTNTIVLGSNNTVTTSDTVVIGDNNTVSFSGASYTYGIDTATSDSSGTLVQMNPDGTYEFINH